MAEFSFREDGIYCGEIPISNYGLKVMWRLHSLGNQNLEAILLHINAPDGERQLIVNTDASIVKQISQHISTALLWGPVDTKAVDAFIIKSACESAEAGVIFQDCGLHHLPSGDWVYVAGNEIIGNRDLKAVVGKKIESIHLAIDANMDEEKALCRVASEMMKNRKSVWPTFCYTLLAAMRSELVKLGVTTFPALYITGKQGAGKTWLVSTYCLIYREELGACGSRLWGELEANSTPKGIEQAFSFSANHVVLVDDLAKASDASVQRERYKTIAQVLRFAANNHARQTASAAIHQQIQICKNGVAFTGEIPLTAASDLERIIEIQLNEPMRGGNATDRAAVKVKVSVSINPP